MTHEATTRLESGVITFFEITARKQAEEDLRSSEERWRLLIESAKDYAIFTFDAERRVNSWNSGAEAAMGYSHSEIVGQLADVLFTPEDKNAGVPAKEAHTALFEGYAENERWHMRKDGTRFYGSGTVRPLYGGDDDHIGFIKIMRDLTEAKRTEEANYFLASIVESSEDSVISINFESIITSWNKSAESLYGYRAAEAIGKPLSLVTLPQDIKTLFNDIDRIKDRQTVEVYDTIRTAKGGESISLEVMLSPVKSAKGDIIGVSTIGRNVTPRKNSERALRESEQRFRAIVSQTAAGICLAGSGGDIDLVNEKLCSMLGYEEKELIGMSIWDVTFSEDRKDYKSLFEKSRSQGKSFEMEKRLVQKDGNPLWVNESLSFIQNNNDEPESSVSVLMDITERKRVDEQKDDFIGVASHELKTPVTSIKAYGEILLEKFEKSKHKNEVDLIKRMNAQVRRLSFLISDLLDTTNIAQGLLELHKEKFDLSQLIADRMEDLSPVSQKHELTFDQIKIKPITADKERIGAVLTNLLTNAIKYSPEGGKVIVSVENEESGVSVSVSDEGIGLSDEVRGKIFERFFRVSHPGVSSIHGMGLGLYISAGIVHRHGGTLSVKSKLGEGSIFTFTLPRG